LRADTSESDGFTTMLRRRRPLGADLRTVIPAIACWPRGNNGRTSFGVSKRFQPRNGADFSKNSFSNLSFAMPCAGHRFHEVATHSGRCRTHQYRFDVTLVPAIDHATPRATAMRGRSFRSETIRWEFFADSLDIKITRAPCLAQNEGRKCRVKRPPRHLHHPSLTGCAAPVRTISSSEISIERPNGTIKHTTHPSAPGGGVLAHTHPPRLYFFFLSFFFRSLTLFFFFFFCGVDT